MQPDARLAYMQPKDGTSTVPVESVGDELKSAAPP
jgi:hypothetical protein